MKVKVYQCIAHANPKRVKVFFSYDILIGQDKAQSVYVPKYTLEVKTEGSPAAPVSPSSILVKKYNPFKRRKNAFPESPETQDAVFSPAPRMTVSPEKSNILPGIFEWLLLIRYSNW